MQMFPYIGQFSLKNISPLKFVTKALSFWRHNSLHSLRKTSWSLSLLKEQSWLAKSMQFSIVDVASFWAAVWSNIAGNHPIHGQTKIFELFKSRGHFGTLNPSLTAIKSFVFQQSKQYFQTFWLEVEVLCCLLSLFFRKHDGWKSQGRRSIGRHLLPAQRLFLSQPMIIEV